MECFISQEHLFLCGEPVGPFAMNQYLVGCPRAGEAAIIDSGSPPGPFLEVAEQQGLKITKLLQTHGHIDHVAGLLETARATGAPSYMHPLDLMNLQAAERYGAMIGFPVTTPERHDIDLAEGDVIRIGHLAFEVLHTPGHAPGHVCFVERTHKIILGGDLLFRLSIGRTDLPGCDNADMARSLKRMLDFSDDFRIFPGHMGPTTIGFERRANPFLQDL